MISSYDRTVRGFVSTKMPVDSTNGVVFSTGSIRYFNREKGFGFIIREYEEDLFFHVSKYSEVELDRNELTLKFKQLEYEEKIIPVKMKTPSIETDEDRILQLRLMKIESFKI